MPKPKSSRSLSLMADPVLSTHKQRHVAALLLSKGALSAGELLRVVGGDKTSLKRCLERLQARGVLDYVASETGTAAPGRPAGLWSLTSAGKRATATTQASNSEDGVEPAAAIKMGQTWVGAAVEPSAAADFMAVFADGELAAAASSIVRLDGEGQSYLFVFDAGVGDQPSDNLRAALEAINVACTVSTVREPRPPGEFVSSVQTARSAATRAITRREAQ